MKASDLRGKEIAELKSELTELYREQFNLRMQRGTGQSPRPHQFSAVRKNIARVKTILTEKQQAE
ncbi:MAG: 50S ribosomal protein L29 [Thiotrichales bacterium]